MDNQNAEKDGSKKIRSAILSVIVIVVVVAVIPNLFSGDFFRNKSIASAEKYVNQQVYKSLGLACDSFDSERIYKDGNIQLISVRFYFEGSETPIGSYCVYCVDGYVYNCTTMMGPEYDFESSLPELKALFGI